jgi:polyhydroxybutyrate depolymerase
MSSLLHALLGVVFLVGCGGGAPETLPPPAPPPTSTVPLPAWVEQRTTEFQQRTRTYLLYVPPNPGTQRLPTLILHHGTGGTGLEMINMWRSMADAERIILIAPKGEHGFGWMVPDDGPMMQIQIVEELKQRSLPIDPRRVYLFGYSNGGDFVFYAGIQQADYFAATAVGFAALRPRQFPMLDLPSRKEPLWYTAGTEDQVFTIEEARATVAALQARSWPLEYMERAGVGHAYDPDLQNPIAWNFLKQHTLPAEPMVTALTPEWLSFALR